MSTFHFKTCIHFVARSTQADYISFENKATLLLAELVESRWSPSTGKAVRIMASFRMSSIMPWASTTSKPEAIVTSMSISTWRTCLLIWPTTSRNKTPTTKTRHMTTAPSLHYGRTAFSIQPGLETITPIPDDTVEIGQMQGMSNCDILRDQQAVWMLKMRNNNNKK